ncbi:type-1 fimbrial protein subunit A [Erwinia sp. OLTSP20]|uniref:type 1 fimbrial major subunit FimA n=1 Tax=unclassified Erwinia TaxID=2622719 RepID=UPI000C562048|nr:MULTISPECIES: type 1 fimbrial major subunit FimA [unclassified Erwinia]PIJ49864.1 type-1 fimbrial protein subunit A [Erwinia sp. OAMSP11]PIJ70962.1 type-1 fimbrial protein subunit A [Erwinia sp. OLSSP12]PIJ80328.1 type-1 fimbrial protein subunit A [Erwinia sp. OLCASP19]PIJ82452.1 type-1 fimbrial protein subunit A [Erwinia sp. OLMTSP26]PIJ85137.1 type-1 fimbrial protein subunit A [Erwinia sp. OLMDSP33]
MKLNKVAVIFGTMMIMSAGIAHAADGDGGGGDKKTTTVSGGTVHFRGSLVDAACAVSSDSSDQIVTMGQYTLHHFKKIGDKSGSVPFKIKLEDCDSTVASTAAMAFIGQQDSVKKDLLAIDTGSGNTSTATGVAIQILDESSKALTPDGATFSTPHKLIDGMNILSFSAQYVSTSATPTAGEANADATFIMQYQ